MRYCPECGIEMPVGAVNCSKCGGELAENLVEVETRDPAVQVDIDHGEPGTELLCAHCGEGRLIPVEEGAKQVRYLCEMCNWYYGDFLHTGIQIYYDTQILKIAMYIRGQIHSEGSFEQDLGDHELEEGFQALASRISVDTSIDKKEVMETIDYCIENGVLDGYSENDGGPRHVGLRFNVAGSSVEAPLELTK